jgi:hypothetical protein
MSTGEDWYKIMFDVMRTPGPDYDCNPNYSCGNRMFLKYSLFFNLFYYFYND